MKRTILLITVLIGGVYAFADEPEESKTRYYRHEVNVSLTGMFMPRSQWDDYEKKVYQAMVYEPDYDNGYSLFGPSSSGPLISKTKPRVRRLINVKKPHFLHFDA